MNDVKYGAIVAMVGAILVSASPAISQERIYWVNNPADTISFANLDGSGGGGQLSAAGATVKGPFGLAIDPAAGKIYWTNNSSGSNTIAFANLDGSGGGQLSTLGATVSAPAGLAIDPVAGKIYWANLGSSTIAFARLDGTGGGQFLTTGATVVSARGMAIDRAAGRLYWVNGNNTIGFANLDGTGGGGQLSTTGATMNGPAGAAIDPVAGRIYWTNESNNTISFTKLDGSGGGGQISTTGATPAGPFGAAVDPIAGRIYWANNASATISFANLDGSGGGGQLSTSGASPSGSDFPVLLKLPAGVGAPAISGGGRVGEQLTCSQGSWAADLLGSFLFRAPRSFAHQWLMNGADIPGATQTTYTPSSPGQYTCRVTATNHAGSTSQTAAPLTVVLHTPTLSTLASSGVVFGESVSDTAMISGGLSPTGTITFRLYGPNDATCASAAVFTDMKVVGGNGSYASSSFTPAAAGVYRWIASYNGDGFNNAVAGTCNAPNESVTIGKSDQTITFGALSNRAVDAGPFTVSATATSNLPVTLTPQTPAVCTLSGSTVTTLAVGTCTILASQGGDGNYNAATPVPRSFTVLPNCAIVTILPGSLATALAGTAYSQTFTIANGASPATFTLSGTLPSGLTFSSGVMSGTPSGKGVFPVTVSATDANACQVSASFTLGVSPQRRFVAGAGGGASTVRALTLNGTIASEFTVYAPGFTGGVPVAQGDVNGDGVADIITGSGPTGEPRVNLIDGATNAVVASYLAFDPAIRGGVEVAAGDITGDGVPEIIAAPGCDGPLAVRAFDVRTGMLVREYPAGTTAWGCGLHVAAGDVNGDGVADLVVGSGGGGSPFVAVIDGYTGATLRQFLPYASGFRGGVYVAAADLTGDGFADIITGAGPGGGPHVQVFDGVTGMAIAGPLASFYAYEAAFTGGVRVAAGDLNGDGRAELITGAGPGGGPHVRVFDGASGTEILGAYAFDPSMTGGVFVAAPPPIARMALDLPAPGASGTTIRIAGWALKQIAIDTDGTDVIHAWAYPVAGGVPVFVGATTSRVARSDVAAIFGGEFLLSGFDFTGTLAPGTYDLVVFARNGRSLRFDQLRIVRITVN